MRVQFTITRLFQVPAPRLFDFTNDDVNFTTFTGYGPIPGITQARYQTPGPPRLGALRRVLKADGTEHVEEIIAFDRPHRHTSLITEIAPPFSWLVREGLDDWQLRPEGSLTVVERTFSFELTSVLAAPLVWAILHLFMKEAVRRDLENVMEKCR